MGLAQFQGFHVGDAHLVLFDPQGQQGKKLADGIVLAIPGTAGQKLHRRGPVVGLPPVLTVFDEPQTVEKLIDLAQFGGLTGIAVALDERLPVHNPLFSGRTILPLYVA